jgi:2-oxo-4-hydroxy-4-carboxy-5-ureidoimidazoline decarboxylase
MSTGSAGTTGLSSLNSLPPAAFVTAVTAVCASPSFALALLTARPFASTAALYDAADAAWTAASEPDVLAAFAAHPRIGQPHNLHKPSNKPRSQSTDFTSSSGRFAEWSSGEQSGVANASGHVIAMLACRNNEYFERFGFVFLVCATGKSADEMLRLLEARLGNDRQTEIRIAAEEQRKITRLRLTKLLEERESNNAAL